jgi:hypothetical protein
MGTQRMKQIRVTWEKSMAVTVFAPEDMSDEDIERLAQRTAYSLDREWNPPDWETNVGSVNTVEVSDEERTVEVKRNQYGYPCLVARGRFTPDTACAVSDDRQQLVNPTDAKWWMHLSDESTPAKNSPVEKRA